MQLLDKISLPSDLRKLPQSDLKQLSSELRTATINAVSKTGGHLGAGLGVVELTVALHYVFNTPDDKLIWDVGHQAYPHKILTGRKDRITTLRQPDGLSGFTKRAESEYDVFGAGHSSTSISAALGFAVARDLKDEKRNVIAIIGDGAISAGMAYEALNNAGATHNRLIVILNDNDMSIAPPVGAMSNYLSKLASSKSYLKFRGMSKKVLDKLPENISKFPKKIERATKEWWMGGNIFEEMGFYYIGPVDGHNLDVLIPILQNIRDDNSTTPILIHAVTKKGQGYNETMKSEDCLHAVAKFNPETGIQDKKSSGNPTYSQVFGEALTHLAKQDDKIVAITAAMPTGTGLDIFAKEFSTTDSKAARLFDVGIAEQHAVTFAAGLACEGIKPFVAIYSTFLQRAYDQVVHDVAVQKLPVRFAIDRAGFVGADGPTHAGCYDVAYLINLPNFVLMAPRNSEELARMLATAADINDRPSAVRFPRGEGSEVDLKNIKPLEIGKGIILQEGSEIAILCYGTIIENAFKASKILEEKHNIKITIADARFAKPLDEELIFDLANKHKFLIALEEGAFGGFGLAVMNLLSINGYLEKSGFKFRAMFMKDEFIEQNNINVMQDQSGIGVADIVKMVTNS